MTDVVLHRMALQQRSNARPRDKMALIDCRLVPPRIAIFMSTSGHSGVDRAMRHLIPALASRGYAVDLLKVRRHGPELRDTYPNVRVLDTGVSTTYAALPYLVRYLRKERPAVLLSDKDKVNRTALLARWLAGASEHTRLVLSSGTTVSIDLQHRGWIARLVQRFSMRYVYPLADQVIVTCEAVADDMSQYTGLARKHICAVASPVVPHSLVSEAQPVPAHPWYGGDSRPPVVLGVGELAARKDFATLIRAFALVRAQRAARLIIVGKGRELDALKALSASLGVGQDVDFVGFRSDVYAYMAHAQLFVMTSRWEGLGFVLIEALACGTPVVATDCPSGPAEVLNGGEFGRLVPVGAVEALAKAMIETLEAPPDAASNRKAVERYGIDAATTEYLRAFDLPAWAPGFEPIDRSA